MEELFSLNNLGSLLMLTVMEVVLGIDNIIFISIVAGKLPHDQQRKARMVGLGLALLVRVGLLFAITWIMGLTKPLFEVMDHPVAVKDLILLSGGLFLMWKSVSEIHGKLEGHDESMNVKTLTLQSAIIQIVLLDIVFSFDSILTAIGVAEHVEIMIGAVILSMGVMLMFAKPVSDFVNRHPSIKMLALSFLLMIGFLLMLEGLPDTLHLHVPKGYLYFAMAFSFVVEMLNIRMRKKARPVKIHQPHYPNDPDAAEPGPFENGNGKENEKNYTNHR